MFSCLSHNTICSSYYEDTSIHLSSTSDHVLNVIGMTWAVNVSVMSLFCFIFNVSCRDCDTSFSFFWSLIDIFECNSFTCTKSLMKSLCDSSCKSCLTVIYVSNCTNVAMWFCSFKFSLCHCLKSS